MVLKIQKKKQSLNFNQRQIPIVVLHATGVDLDQTMAFLCGEKGLEISVHYVIDLDGQIYQLVDEDKRAFHAGSGAWSGMTDVNSLSIGIEFVMPSDEEVILEGVTWPEKLFNHVSFSEKQIESGISLLKDIQARYPRMRKEHVIGHHEMSFMRKFDPGPCFPWQDFADAGLCYMPIGACDDQTVLTSQEKEQFLSLLGQYGYDVFCAYDQENIYTHLVQSFQMRYGRGHVTGQATKGNLEAIKSLIRQRLEGNS